MASCRDFPTDDSIFITTEDPNPVTIECPKNGEGNYFCPRPVQDGFWKLAKGENNSCRWYNCKKPYRTDQDGNPVYKSDGSLDTSDFSDCIVTNYPYFIRNDGGSCSVHNIFTGDSPEEACQTIDGGLNEMCCTDNEVCSSLDCLGYRPADRYLVTTSLDYDCNNGSCVPVPSGQGSFTNPFCDYQCANLIFPKNYTCVNGYCQQVADTSDTGRKYFDNPFCDEQCPYNEDVSFNCDSKNQICQTVKGSGGQYKKYGDCSKACSPSGSLIPKSPFPPESTATKVIRAVVIIVIVLINILAISVMVFAFNKVTTKNQKVSSK